MSDAEQMGQDAYFMGDSIGMNPFDEDDAQYDEWNVGYSHAGFCDEDDDDE